MICWEGFSSQLEVSSSKGSVDNVKCVGQRSGMKNTENIDLNNNNYLMLIKYFLRKALWATVSPTAQAKTWNYCTPKWSFDPEGT